MRTDFLSLEDRLRLEVLSNEDAPVERAYLYIIELEKVLDGKVNKIGNFTADVRFENH